MAFFQIPAPDLASLSVGGVTLHLLESYGFSSDESYLLVRATYTDDADTSYALNYGFFIYDLQERAYVSNLNGVVAGSASARDVDITKAQMAGSADELTTVALLKIKGADEMRLVSVVNGQLTSTDIIASLTDVLNVAIEQFALDSSGRFLAVQTSNPQFAADNQPDTNDSSDIYLIDLLADSVTRVSYVGGSEVSDPTYLKSIVVDGNQVRIAFVTDAAFVQPSKVDLNSANLVAEAGFRSDLYVWSAGFDVLGVMDNGTFELQSIGTDGTATGFVDRDDPAQITTSGVFYSSNAETLVLSDNNGRKDPFLTDTEGQVARLNPPSVAELEGGGQFLGASESGQYVALLSDSVEIALGTGAQQVVLFDRAAGEGRVVSDNGQLANNWVTGGAVSPSGRAVAFTSSADNLTSEPLVAPSGSLFVNLPDSFPLSGRVYHWGSATLLDNVDIGIVEVQEGEPVDEAVAVAVTSEGGEYTLLNPLLSDGLLTASRTLEAVDISRVVTSADALAALKIAVGINPNTDSARPVSPYQLIAADMNKDGRVSSADALEILKTAVGLPDTIPQEWLFVPEKNDYWEEATTSFTLSRGQLDWESDGFRFSSPDMSEGNFIALLLGDVNGSWRPATGDSLRLTLDYFLDLEDAGLGPVEQWGAYWIA